MLLITAQLEIKKIRPFFKPWSAPRLPSVQKLHEAQKNLASFLEPVIQARRDAEKNDPEWQKPDDMLTWLMNRQGEFGVKSTKHLAQLLLGLIFASIHTTTLTATNM
jgi:cytochrome P450